MLHIRTVLLLAVCSPALAGCFGTFQPATATFETVDKPVLLGPIDRIGGGAALKTHHVSDYEGEAISLSAHSETATTTTDTTVIDNVSMVKEARDKLGNAGPTSDIRVTKLRPWAKGYVSFVKNTVLVEGNVVTIEGAR
jgi:hypothetical protein